jgi:hypothetical protein
MSRRHLILRDLGALVIVLTLGQGSVAHANMIYNFSYTVVTDNGGGTDYTGLMDVDTDGATVIGITGTSSEYGPILSLLPVNAYGINDNQLFPDTPYLTFFGISFSVDGHGYSNLYDDVHLGWSEFNNTANTAGTPNSSGILTVSPVPEPSSLSVFAAGLAAFSIAGVLRFRNAPARRTSFSRAS